MTSRSIGMGSTSAPSPWGVGIAALVVTTGYWMASGFNEDPWHEWAGVLTWCLVVVMGVLMISRWSRHRGWNERHRFALAPGATLTHV
ncbi:hypothetical protein CIW52_01100 [Mycolicibacterium sp. P9-64]|uniref:hypothetical protein n=1 Tax=Mycolicibacterium sp. P9-64 TaxID=2024612 RepID=UPI0011EC3C52|nr:hypothetical protein [Mycolicibacterium sp. P9-64]KAA0086559.1 hypothetical protein CIW52_01100 [Mycolicibacterium sp. P9-64]